MREREIREFFKTKKEKDLDKLIEIGENVSAGLRLEEGTPINYFQERFQVVGVIADTIYDTTKYLGINVPKVELLYDWKDEVGRRTYMHIPAATEKGIIKFSPDFLSTVAKGFAKKGIGSKPQINALVNTAGHEVYHCFQMERFPNSSEKDFKKDAKNYNIVVRLDMKLENMPHSRSERGALVFGRLVEKVKSSRI